MKNENIVQLKSFEFAIEIVKIYKYLCETKKEFTLSKQLLRSGTSVGANIEEALGGQSRKDFYAKLTISYKEARESKYWIRLLMETNYLDKIKHNNMLEKAEELLRIIGSIQKSIRNS
mgnify:CR=1 FL=1